MAIVLPKKKLGLQTVHQRGGESVDFEQPNPGDVFMLMAFGWASICFLMVTFGKQLAVRAAKLSASQNIRELLLSEQTAIAGLMLVGIVGLAAAFWVFHRYKNISIAMFIAAITCANASWPPVHDVAFAIKYLTLLYLGSYGAVFFLKNGWRLVGTKFYRIYVFYVGWIALVSLLTKARIGDLWYTATEFTLMIGFGVAWMMHLDNRSALLKFNRIVCFTAIPITFLHMLSPLLVDEFMAGGRFVSMFIRATGFSTIYSIFVISLFWLSMYEKKPNLRQIYTILALIGFGMILLSGTRNATVATLAGLGALWWVFRSKIFIYIVFVGIVGLLIQTIIGGVENLEMLTERLQSTENSRLAAWEMYIRLLMESPIIGYGFEGLVSAVWGETMTNMNAIYSSRRLIVPGVHNNYLGFGVRWGLVGLGLQLTIYTLAFRQAWKVIFSARVAMEDKRIYILPVTWLMLVALEALFEDTMSSTGRGTLHGVIYAVSPIILYVYGARLLDTADEEYEANADQPASSSRSSINRPVAEKGA
ncbi:MAG: O-antigen ligase family protein [Gammaproteobacteria bacterium]|jgi:O-antigen ligase|nr:O-antigen ligase family protein [Gammaproteobacteria bacterium]